MASANRETHGVDGNADARGRARCTRSTGSRVVLAGAAALLGFVALPVEAQLEFREIGRAHV